MNKGIRTKRNCKWSQNVTCQILLNEIYTGKIINEKQEISDFLTGQRREKDETEWTVTEKQEIRIIDDETFEKDQKILHSRYGAFNMNHEQHSNKYLFSTLIKCKECGWSFRRSVRKYKNTYIRWMCSGHNGKGAAHPGRDGHQGEVSAPAGDLQQRGGVSRKFCSPAVIICLLQKYTTNNLVCKGRQLCGIV